VLVCGLAYLPNLEYKKPLHPRMNQKVRGMEPVIVDFSSLADQMILTFRLTLGIIVGVGLVGLGLGIAVCYAKRER
jgi:hypothetical protein